MKTLIPGITTLLTVSMTGIAQAATQEGIAQAGTVAGIAQVGTTAGIAPSPATLLIFGAGIVTLMLIAMRQSE